MLWDSASPFWRPLSDVLLKYDVFACEEAARRHGAGQSAVLEIKQKEFRCHGLCEHVNDSGGVDRFFCSYLGPTLLALGILPRRFGTLWPTSCSSMASPAVRRQLRLHGAGLD